MNAIAYRYSAHWLAVEGVQPSIPQNPTTADSRNQELVPKGPGAHPNASAINGDNVTVKPLVKHILSKELLLYFEKICGALVDENSDEYRLAALASIRTDPGLHQLVPYFVQFIAEKVTHNLKDLFVLTQMMHLTMAMLDNDSLYVNPYVSRIPLFPIVTTTLMSKDRIPHSPDPNLPYRSTPRSQLHGVHPRGPNCILSFTFSRRLHPPVNLQKVCQVVPQPQTAPRPDLP